MDLAHKNCNNFPCAIVGIDIAAGEAHFNEEQHPELYLPHKAAFDRAQELKLNITLHAGECFAHSLTPYHATHR